MKREKDTSCWTPDKKISWAASLLIVVLTNFFVVFLKSIGTIDLEGGTWWVGTAIGCALAAMMNWLRPRYDRAGRFWKPIYRFLLEQMPHRIEMRTACSHLQADTGSAPPPDFSGSAGLRLRERHRKKIAG